MKNATLKLLTLICLSAGFTNCSGDSTASCADCEDPGDSLTLSLSGLANDRIRLESSDSCEQLNGLLRAQALQVLKNYWQGYDGCPQVHAYGEDGNAIEDGTDAGSTEVASDSGDADYTEQNSQVENVYEPDTIFTNGEIIAVLSGGMIKIFDAWPVAEMGLVATIANGHDGIQFSTSKIILTGDTLLAFGRYHNTTQKKYYGAVAEIDVSRPSDPVIVAVKMIEDSSWLNARLSGDKLISVFLSTVGPSYSTWMDYENYKDLEICDGDNLSAAFQAVVDTHIAEQEGMINAYDVSSDLGALKTLSATAGSLTQEEAMDCGDVLANATINGTQLTHVVATDLDDFDGADQHLSVLGYSGNIYMNSAALILYSAVNLELYKITDEDGAEIAATVLHRFDIDGDDLKYVASGGIPGTIPTPWAIDEQGGIVRVASEIYKNADDADFWTPDFPADIVLNVLEQDNDALKLVGQKTGIVTDEEIYAVRYLEDTAYLVTYRLIDPLFIIDTSDPTNPVVTGALEVPGVSTYLGVLDDDRLFGVGLGSECVDDNCWRDGTAQVSLFDVSGAVPERTAVETIDMGYSAATYNHLAVHFEEDGERLYLPFSDYASANGYVNTVAVYAFEGETIEAVLTIAPDYDDIGVIQRTMIFSDDETAAVLITIGTAGILPFDAATGEAL